MKFQKAEGFLTPPVPKIALAEKVMRRAVTASFPPDFSSPPALAGRLDLVTSVAKRLQVIRLVCSAL